MSRHFGNPSQVKSAALAPKARLFDFLAIYGAFGLIAAIVFGAVFSRLF